MELRIDHVALPCFDREATEAFYGKGLGLPLAASGSDTSPVWGNRRFRYLAFALPGGTLLDFFALDGLARPEPDGVRPEPDVVRPEPDVVRPEPDVVRPEPDVLPVGVRHLALGVSSRAELEVFRARLAAAGVWVSEPVEHQGGRLSYYCFDPNGHQLELTHRAEAP